MKPLYTFIVSLIILAALAIKFPDVLLDPGTLMKGHHALKRECLSCHTPFQGVTSVQCVTCHKEGSIGIKNVAGASLPKDSSKVLFHKGLSANSCIECHTDHKGAEASKAIKTFKHASLSISLQKNCTACHNNQKPADNLHRYATGNCSECHTIKEWKPATFDHKRLTASIQKSCITCHKTDQPNDRLHIETTASCADCHSTNRWEPATVDHKKFAASGKQCISCHKADQPNDKLHREVTATCSECHSTTKWKPATFNHKKFAASGKQCISCHKADQPNDKLHRLSEANCATCHGTSRWKPATFNHDRYFRLDRDHQASCKTCHTNSGNYKQYTCYNCHEHTPSNMAAVHREEGIYNYQNCIKCHRNGSRESERGHGAEDDD